jgi:hypothetical protein
MNAQQYGQEFLTSREVAEMMRITLGTVHKRVSDFGDFWGVHPVKGPNGRLLWTAGEIRALIDKRSSCEK